MKECLSRIDNVQRATSAVNYLITRPKSEMVGLGLIYGAPGLGKTRFAMRTAFKNGYLYIRLDSTMNQRSFLTKLYQALQYLYSVPQPIRGSRQKLYFEIVELLIMAPDTVIFIDEIDYAFKDKALLGTIRDLVDETLCTIVLFGMQDAKASLLRANAHYFDRCNSFCEFHKLSLQDTSLIVKDACEVEVDKAIVEWIHKSSKGTVRKIVKLVDYCERVAKARNIKSLKLDDIHGYSEADAD